MSIVEISKLKKMSLEKDCTITAEEHTSLQGGFDKFSMRVTEESKSEQLMNSINKVIALRKEFFNGHTVNPEVWRETSDDVVEIALGKGVDKNESFWDYDHKLRDTKLLQFSEVTDTYLTLMGRNEELSPFFDKLFIDYLDEYTVVETDYDIEWNIRQKIEWDVTGKHRFKKFGADSTIPPTQEELEDIRNQVASHNPFRNQSGGSNPMCSYPGHDFSENTRDVLDVDIEVNYVKVLPGDEDSFYPITRSRLGDNPNLKSDDELQDVA